MWQRRRQRALQAVNCARVAPVLRAVAMAREITQRELRNDSGEVMRALDRGESFLVTRNGVAVGELVPARRRRLVAASTAVAAFAGAPRLAARRLRRDLDALIDQDPRPRA